MRSLGHRLAAVWIMAFALLAFVTAHAAAGCRQIAEATLRWPARPLTTRWSTQTNGKQQPHFHDEAAWVMAWPGMVVVCRLLYLLLALCLLLGELSINIVRVPAVLGLPGGGTFTLSLGVMTALLFFAMACFLGALALELWEVTPTNTHLFPTPSPGVRRVFRTIAVVGFALTVLTVGLVYAAAAILLQTGQTMPQLSILINLLQGILLTVVAVPALWALVLGLLAIVTLVCALLWLILTGLALLCRVLSGGDASVPAAYGDDRGIVASVQRTPTPDRDDWPEWL